MTKLHLPLTTQREASCAPSYLMGKNHVQNLLLFHDREKKNPTGADPSYHGPVTFASVTFSEGREA